MDAGSVGRRLPHLQPALFRIARRTAWHLLTVYGGLAASQAPRRILASQWTAIRSSEWIEWAVQESNLQPWA